MRGLTDKQQRVFDYLCSMWRDEGRIPTVREICSHFGFSSPNAARDHLNALERKGYIDRRPGAARGIELPPDFREPERGIPLVGQVAAGTPIAALENLEGFLELDNLYDRTCHYALRVRGESMIDAGLWDGDFAIVREQPRVENNEIGVAIWRDEATVKRFRYLADGQLELCPANPLFQPFTVDPSSDEFRCGGRVVGVHRVLS